MQGLYLGICLIAMGIGFMFTLAGVILTLFFGLTGAILIGVGTVTFIIGTVGLIASVGQDLTLG